MLEKNFLDDPESVYSGLETQICAGLLLTDLKMPMPPLSQATGETATEPWYRLGTSVPSPSSGCPLDMSEPSEDDNGF